MKKLFIMALAMVTFAGAINAQTTDEATLRKARLEFHKRDASKQYMKSNRQQTPMQAAKGNAKGVQMPQDFWSPGEWEEVKAIVTTVYYNNYPVGHEGDMYWTADPLLGGYADWYHYSGGWQEAGVGRYVSVPDTSGEDFSNVFYYLIDAVQSGGAESWVRVEQASDSAIIIRQLERMGLRHNNMKFIVGYGNSFWYRDCGPIAFYYGEGDSIGMVDFMYYPGRALDDSLPYYIEQQMGIPNFCTTIEWEGGNCLVDGAGMLVTSDATYQNNCNDTYGQLSWDGVNPNTINYTTKARLTKQQVKDSLSNLISPRATYVIPAFRYDGGTGHIDLYADMIDENQFVFSKFPDHYYNWTDYKTAQKNIDSMIHWQSVFGNNYKQASIPFPCTNNGSYFSNQTVYNNTYTRSYSNHTFVNNVIIQPVFSRVENGEPTAQWDKERFDSLRLAYPGYTLYPINVASFDGNGGAIHCITKQIPADSPIRILHSSITSKHPELNDGNITINATVTNNKGISGVKCVYRVDGGEWHEENLTANGNDYTCTFNLGVQHGEDWWATIEYYLSATNNENKTITKPMTANQGGYYTFYIGSNIPVGIQESAKMEQFGQFYPNPTSSRANIEVILNGKCNVQMYDIMGRSVYQNSFVADGAMVYTLNTSNLAKGLYQVVFTTGDGQRVARKLMVK